MTSYGELRGYADPWPGTVNRAYMIDTEFQEGSFLADYAKAGKWAKVLEILRPENHLVNVNQSWPGDGTGSTVLHRAVELAAPDDVVAALLDRGALRSLRNADGRTAYDIAADTGQPPSRLDVLRVAPSPFDAGQCAALDANVADVIDHYIRPIFGAQDLRRMIRYPPVEVLHEPPGQELWLQVPMMMGGFRIMLRDGHVELLGGYRRPGESGEWRVVTHRFVVTPSGTELVSESTT